MRIMDSMKIKEFLNKIKPLGYSWEYTGGLCGFPTDLSILCKGKPDIAVGLDWKNLIDTKKDGDIVNDPGTGGTNPSASRAEGKSELDLSFLD